MQCDLSGQVALVTGATGALGGAMALALARAGADVAVHYHRNEQKAKSLADEIEALGRKAVTVQAELAERDHVQAMRDRIASSLGEASVVVANAVSQVHPWQPLLEEDPDDYVDQFRSCVLQTVHLAQAFLPGMKARRYGRYIGISTECVMQNTSGQSAYVSGKRGMDGALRSLCREVAADQITVNQVAPGFTISDRNPETQGTDYAKAVPMKRRGTAQEVANAVVFLASPQASYITGAWLPVCGGNVLPAI